MCFLELVEFESKADKMVAETLKSQGSNEAFESEDKAVQEQREEPWMSKQEFQGRYSMGSHPWMPGLEYASRGEENLAQGDGGESVYVSCIIKLIMFVMFICQLC